MRILIIILAIINSFTCRSQTAFVKKLTKGEKASLVVGIKNGDSTDWYSANCFFKNVTILPDTTKIQLIGELLDFTADTTTCYNPVYNLSGHYETIKREPTNKEYNLQIDALILINYIAFSSNAFIYSPYPILYDKESGKEIYCYGDGLKEVIKMYKNWFKKLQQAGFKGYYYPLLDGKYEWFASRVKQQRFKEYPSWNSFYNCKEIE